MVCQPALQGNLQSLFKPYSMLIPGFVVVRSTIPPCVVWSSSRLAMARKKTCLLGIMTLVFFPGQSTRTELQVWSLQHRFFLGQRAVEIRPKHWPPAFFVMPFCWTHSWFTAKCAVHHGFAQQKCTWPVNATGSTPKWRYMICTHNQCFDWN